MQLPWVRNLRHKGLFKFERFILSLFPPSYIETPAWDPPTSDRSSICSCCNYSNMNSICAKILLSFVFAADGLPLGDMGMRAAQLFSYQSRSRFVFPGSPCFCFSCHAMREYISFNCHVFVFCWQLNDIYWDIRSRKKDFQGTWSYSEWYIFSDCITVQCFILWLHNSAVLCFGRTGSGSFGDTMLSSGLLCYQYQ